MSDTPKVWIGDLATVYVDPVIGPANILAYIPQAHASSRCPGRIRGGATVEVTAELLWCDQCTTPNEAEATVRRGPDGAWLKN